MYETVLWQGCHNITGKQFEKRVRLLGKQRTMPVRFEIHGKGSHSRLYYGDRFTTLKDRKKEIGVGLLKAMCMQLGIDSKDL